MSRCLLLVLLFLVGLSECSPITTFDDSNETSSAGEEDLDVLSRLNSSDPAGVPVGRTFLLLQLLKHKLLHKLEGKYSTTQFPFRGCICVPFYLCDVNGTIISDGAGVIDPRYRQCTGDLEVCCFIRPPTIPTIPTTIPTTPTTIPTTPTTIPTTPTTIRTTPTTIPTTPTTIPTTPTTLPTTPSTTPVRQICVCVPVFQCAFYGSIGGGPVVYPQQAISTCIGAYVCCSNVPAQPPATFPPYTLPPLPPTTIPTTTTTTTTTTTPAPPVILPPIVIGQSCICMLIAACGLGYIPVSGAGNLDPRLILGRQGQPSGSCGGPDSMCCKVGQPAQSNFGYPQVGSTIISGYGALGAPIIPSNVPSGALPPGNIILPNSVFPSNVVLPGSAIASGSVGLPGPASNAIALSAGSSAGASAVGTIKNAGTPNACKCVPETQCVEGNAVTHDGVGASDPRFGPCASATLVCCRLQTRQKNELLSAASSSYNTILIKSAIVIPSQQQQQPTCGVQDTTYSNNPSPLPGTAYFAEFPWMALLLIRKPGASDTFQCGGTLINNRAILTAAHCVVSCDPGTLIVRLGEWNTQATNEPLPLQEVPVSAIVIHPQYYSPGLYNDVAIVILSKPASMAANVRPICLPAQGQVFASGTRCFASGWGRSAFGEGGEYQTVLRKIDLPIVDNVSCETRLRSTRLGAIFQLHPSFICAGGESNKDTCYKDGGGPLACQDQASGRFFLTGIVSWGIGCGTSVPGVYANVASNRQWVDQQLTLLGVN